jgi:uncharacterized protein (TIGR00730 family)
MTTFSTAKQEADQINLSRHHLNKLQITSSAYRLAYDDLDFMMRQELRPIRLQLELLKPELALSEHGIESTVVIFGSARILSTEAASYELTAAEDHLNSEPQNPQAHQMREHAKKTAERSRYYEQSRHLSRIITEANLKKENPVVVVTGGGGGIMEGANRGASEVGGKSIGLNIVLPHEQLPNPFVTPELCFQFHYFAIRKMHLLMRAKALVVFPGGFGTLDELFEALTLIQTKKMNVIPIILFDKKYWQRLINFEMLVEEEMISQEDLTLLAYAETAQEVWDKIKNFL